jgi:hypothetical protein
MVNKVKKQVLDALLMTLRPLAKALMRSGVGYREFSDMAKLAFVNVAAEDYGLRGRSTNTSRIAILTGLTRKEIKRIKDLGPGVLAEEFVQESPASIVLQYWHSDPDYLDAEGNARNLSFDQGDHSFSSLVTNYAGDIPPGAMRTELKRVGAIDDVEGGLLRALKRYYLPVGDVERLVIGLQDILSAATDTLAFNSDPKRVAGVDTRFQAVTSVDDVSLKHLPELRNQIRKKLHFMTDDLSNYLGEYEGTSSSNEKNNNQIGVGIFYYELGAKE